jgi:hypothetical protein
MARITALLLAKMLMTEIPWFLGLSYKQQNQSHALSHEPSSQMHAKLIFFLVFYNIVIFANGYLSLGLICNVNGYSFDVSENANDSSHSCTFLGFFGPSYKQ